MFPLSRRKSLSVISAGILGVLFQDKAKAQQSAQEILNGARVTATGNVTLTQDAAGTQDSTLVVNGVPVSTPGIYRQGGQIQVVGNDGSVTATGDVTVSQSASGSQSSETTITYPTVSGQPASSCSPGATIANPDTGQGFYQGRDCCWYPMCANKCNNCQTCAG